jgi:hypothetical protein
MLVTFDSVSDKIVASSPEARQGLDDTKSLEETPMQPKQYIAPIHSDAVYRARFDKKFTSDPKSGCWIWASSRNAKGYGIFWFRGKMVGAHRASYVLFRGEIPDGQLVLHGCDNPPCVNPDHLFMGTHQDNMDDMAAKGRGEFFRAGENHRNAKLTSAQVDEIRARYVHGRGAKLAREFGVTGQSVGDIIAGRSWKEVV